MIDKLKSLNFKKIAILAAMLLTFIFLIFLTITLFKGARIKTNDKKLNNYLLKENYNLNSEVDVYTFNKAQSDEEYNRGNQGSKDSYTYDSKQGLFQYSYANKTLTTEARYDIYYYMNKAIITIGYSTTNGDQVTYYKATLNKDTKAFECKNNKNSTLTDSQICQDINKKANDFNEYVGNIISNSKFDESLFQKK